MYMREFMETAREFGREEDAVGVVEIILILVVLISLVIIFKEQLTNLVKQFSARSQNRVILSDPVVCL